MLIEAFSNRQFNRLKPLYLENEITSIESDLYVLPGKANQADRVIKKYVNVNGEYFGNKLLTINSLIENREKINIDEIVFPEKLAVIDKKIVGYTMKLIDNVNLTLLLNSKEIHVKQKIQLLKQVENIIRRVQCVKGLEDPFLLADIHESNFILEKDSGKVYAVDIDGCKISNNRIYVMKYGSFNEKFFYYPHKYPLDEEDRPIPNINTEWYCFIIMVLNMIGKGPIHKLSIEDYYDYLHFLKEAKFSNELLDCFANIYSNNDNYPPHELLDTIPRRLNGVRLESFEKKKRKKLIM
ncbi:MAG: hypothetical protein PHT75_01470 [Bacilli bacterium]|nr:hypothetical protein [Bacilli bacterium]